jgi:hypothetical protein
MCENFKNEIKPDSSANTDELQSSIIFKSLILTAVIVLVSSLTGKGNVARGFLLGAGISLLYFRMQVIFVKSFSKKDLLSVLMTILSVGRIFLITAVLYVAVKRVDLFDLVATLCGLVAIHLTSFIVFSLNILKNYGGPSGKKKLMIKKL